MKKVYIVIYPDCYYYVDRSIEAVFDAEWKAQKFIYESKNDRLEIDSYDVL